MMKNTVSSFTGLLIASVLLFAAGCSKAGEPYSEKDSQASLATLTEGWHNPPQAARTRVWWHWMNGNVTREGLQKDLEWMKRVGLGGVHQFDAAMNVAPVVEQRLVYLSEGWEDAFAHSVRVADSLGLEFTVASAPGWSSTGGPWVEPQDAMKRLVWRTVSVDGGGQVNVGFPAPFNHSGAFQNGAMAGRGSGRDVEWYEDISVIAVKQPEDRKSAAELGAVLTSSGGTFSIDQLTDGDIRNGSLLPADDKAGFAWIQYAFPEPVTVRSLAMVGLPGGGFPGQGGGASTTSLECSNDGVNYTKVCDLRGGSMAQATLSVPETTARYFRVRIANPRAPQGGMFGMGGGMGMRPGRGPQAPRGTSIAEFELFPYTRVHRFEDKAGFSSAGNLTAMPTPASAEVFPQPEDVVDVTEHFKDGRLVWNAPAGHWRIYRFGYALTGKQNHPAPPEATGLEVDKLDPVAWTKYFRTFFDKYKKAAGGLMGEHGVQYVLTDSYEAENETWTPAMYEEFRNRRGYDLKSWMPVLAGEVIGSPEKSDAFLFDWRATLGDLISDNYTLLSEIARKEYGMLGRYTESHEAGRAYVGDGMDLKATAEVPMGAMWTDASWLSHTPDGGVDRSPYNADDKESASVAHIYGQNIAAAESFTAMGQGGQAYSFHPGNLKFLADIELSNGINRFVIHESAAQPDDIHVPGMSLGGIGQWFNRHETWAEMASVWADYMARSCFMLQAGKNVADILWYYGEDSCVTTEFGHKAVSVPAGYQWDYCSPNALIGQFGAVNGQLVSKSGVSYKVLYMDRNVDYMSLPVLRQIASLAKAGVWIGGAKPKHPASLADDPDEFARLVDEVWGGRYRNVVEASSLDEVIEAAGLQPDAAISGQMRFLHRSLPSAEVYWVNKPSMEYENLSVSFRVSGLKPQVWHPDTGVIEEAAYRIADGRTVVDLEMVPDDAVFVVFAGKASGAQVLPVKTEQTLLTVGGPWKVNFQERRGAPASATFDKLQSYTEFAEPGIKYFSGVATYENSFAAPKVSGQVFLDLGNVQNLAEVYVNGEYCGTVWKEPYRADVSKALREGENRLEIRVANTWPNRLIGDQQPGMTPVTYTDSRPYRAGDPLRAGGLLGPVSLYERK